jgi:hypothetical protein
MLTAGGNEELGENHERCPAIHPAIEPKPRCGSISNRDRRRCRKKLAVSEGAGHSHTNPGLVRSRTLQPKPLEAKRNAKAVEINDAKASKLPGMADPAPGNLAVPTMAGFLPTPKPGVPDTINLFPDPDWHGMHRDPIHRQGRHDGIQQDKPSCRREQLGLPAGEPARNAVQERLKINIPQLPKTQR